MSLEKFVAETLQLLERERETEIEQTSYLHERLPAKELERRGICLVKLRINDRSSGLYGRTIVSFEPYWSKKQLPSHNLTPGDVVGLALNSNKLSDQLEILVTGIIFRVTPTSIAVAFEESQDVFSLADNEYYKILKLTNDVTYKRLKKALNQLHKFRFGPARHLIDVLFGEEPPCSPGEMPDLKFFKLNLNDSQTAAVKFALSQRDVAIIHGPPGTGKTTTLVEIILQALKQGQKVLACATSNIAVDNLVERLAGQKQRIVRLGHPARSLCHLQNYSLDAILSASEATQLVADVKKDLDETYARMKEANGKAERNKLRDDARFFRKELKQRMGAATREILKNANVVLVTLTSAASNGPMKFLDDEHFDIVVIDECSQALEAACWMALLKAPRCVLAGDHHQLPPTILSSEAAKGGLELTLMERALKLHGEKIVRMLTTQYRMHQLIMQWPSNQLYEGQLTADSSVRDHLLRDLEGVEDNEITGTPLLLIDTVGCGLSELDLPDEESKGNEGEADIVRAHVEKLIASGLSSENIAVIAPYNLQVELLRLRLSQKYTQLEIKSVDGFQGREKEAVVISFVRSNEKGEVGFLGDDRRINVAITRARRHLAVICNTETVGHSNFLKSLVTYMSEKGEVHSAYEYIQEIVGVGKPIRPDHISSLIGLKSSSQGTKQGKEKREQQLHGQEKEKAAVRDAARIKDDEKKLEALQKILVDFQGDSQLSSHTFPSSLTSYERFLVHEISEKLGLIHVSQGESEKRVIEVRKPKPAVWNSSEERVLDTTENKEDAGEVHDYPGTEPEMLDVASVNRFKLIEEVENESEGSDVAEEKFSECRYILRSAVSKSQMNNEQQHTSWLTDCRSEERNCPFCHCAVTKANYQLHVAHCSRKPKERQKDKPKKVSKPDKMAKALQEIDASDFDSLIATVERVNSRCSFSKCKTCVTTMGQNCQFCHQRFCFTHYTPEVHGCGNSAKAHARALFCQEGMLHHRSIIPRKKINKAHLHKKLEKKLTVMATVRKPKRKEQ